MRQNFPEWDGCARIAARFFVALLHGSLSDTGAFGKIQKHLARDEKNTEGMRPSDFDPVTVR
jgi:hypothetical protein